MDKQEYYHDKTGRFSAVDKLMMGHPEPIQAENLEVGVCIAFVTKLLLRRSLRAFGLGEYHELLIIIIDSSRNEYDCLWCFNLVIWSLFARLCLLPFLIVHGLLVRTYAVYLTFLYVALLSNHSIPTDTGIE